MKFELEKFKQSNVARIFLAYAGCIWNDANI